MSSTWSTPAASWADATSSIPLNQHEFLMSQARDSQTCMLRMKTCEFKASVDFRICLLEPWPWIKGLAPPLGTGHRAGRKPCDGTTTSCTTWFGPSRIGRAWSCGLPHQRRGCRYLGAIVRPTPWRNAPGTTLHETRVRWTARAEGHDTAPRGEQREQSRRRTHECTRLLATVNVKTGPWARWAVRSLTVLLLTAEQLGRVRVA